MPRGDGTGPAGAGPMTGGGWGYCAGFDVPGYLNVRAGGFGFPSGRGLGLGLRGRRGFRNMFYATGLPAWARGGYPQKQDASALKAEEEALKKRLEAVRKQLDSLEQS